MLIVGYPRDYINVAIIEAGKQKRYICRKVFIEPKGDTNAILSRRYGFILANAKFGFSRQAVEAARDWLNRIRTTTRRSRSERAAFIYKQRLTPALAVWAHYKRT